MNSYFCVQCNMVHSRSYSTKETIFKSGFHYLNSTLYNVGVCNKQINMALQIEDQTTINSFVLCE